MALLRYISHPEVVIDGDVPVAQWGLTDHGRKRAEAMVDQPWLGSVTRLICSDETKALEVAALIETRFGLTPEVRPETAEIDRSGTGFIAEPRYSEVSSAFFANPDRSPHGWERAVDGQARIRAALADVLLDDAAGGPDGHAGDDVGHDAGDIAVIGHGGVGTLLWCDLAGIVIDERHDQPFAGHLWTYDRSSGSVVHPWWPIDVTDPSGSDLRR